jgi:hypothetical protein
MEKEKTFFQKGNTRDAILCNGRLFGSKVSGLASKAGFRRGKVFQAKLLDSMSGLSAFFCR